MNSTAILLADKVGTAHVASPVDDATIVAAARQLTEAGVPVAKFSTITGFGARRVAGCKPEDTVLVKLATGALSIHGVMAVLYGTDSPEHHAGRVAA